MKIAMVTIDCADPTRLVQFWTEALDAKVVHNHKDEFVILGPKGDDGVMLGLQKVSEPKNGKNRAHPDLLTDDRDADVRRLAGIGATVVAEHKIPGFAWTVMTDPEGNEFCVGGSEPDES